MPSIAASEEWAGNCLGRRRSGRGITIVSRLPPMPLSTMSAPNVHTRPWVMRSWTAACTTGRGFNEARTGAMAGRKWTRHTGDPPKTPSALALEMSHCRRSRSRGNLDRWLRLHRSTAENARLPSPIPKRTRHPSADGEPNWTLCLLISACNVVELEDCLWSTAPKSPDNEGAQLCGLWRIPMEAIFM